MKLAALISGGKDSVYAAYLAKHDSHEIKYLLAVIPESDESWMFHHPNIELTKLQAEAIRIQILTEKTRGEKEKELEDLKTLISRIKDDIDGVITGAVASRYQSERLKKICDEFGLKLVSPSWNRDLESYWDELIDNDFEIIIVSVAAQGLGKEWLGRKMDKNAVAKLKEVARKNKINIAGEGGEFETFVLNCPLFKKRIEIIKSETKWDDKTQTGQFHITEAKLS